MSQLESLLRIDRKEAQAFIPLADALPLEIHPEGASEAFLLLHGFSGYPGELATLALTLAEAGYAVHAPRFPGHGTCRRDFLGTSAEDWTRCAYDSYMNLRARYPRVHVLGHSMGALLASAVAISFEAPRLVLLAPAFELSIRLISFTRIAAPFIKVIRSGRPPSEFDRSIPARQRLQAEYWSDVLVGPAAEMERLRRRCRAELKRLRSDTLIIAGDSDRTIPVSVIEYIRASAPEIRSLKTHLIKGAAHVFPFNEHASETAALVLAWMRGAE